MMQNKNRFRQFIKDNFNNDEQISKILLDGEWGVHAELVAFPEFYNVQIQVFDL